MNTREISDQIEGILKKENCRYICWVAKGETGNYEGDTRTLLNANLVEIFGLFHVILSKLGVRQKDALHFLAKRYAGKDIRDSDIDIRGNIKN